MLEIRQAGGEEEEGEEDQPGFGSVSTLNL